MLNFPLPYPDELLYSTIARAGIRHGLTSPKQLLDEVFNGNRKIVATLDLPNHLSSLTKQLPDRFTSEQLAYQHSLFPLYAPFIPEERRLRCMSWMENKSQGSVHLAMGVAASIVKTPEHIRYCPACLKEQRLKYGEYFWARIWQAPGVSCCPQHGRLLNSKFSRPQNERHQFWPATPEHCPLFRSKPASDKDRWIAGQAEILLNLPLGTSPSFNQWTEYYQRLAQNLDLTRGQYQIDHDKVTHLISSFWSPQYLRAIGLNTSNEDHCWLKGIFRKHRKSFSYLQHLMVHGALLPASWRIPEAIEEARSIVPTPSSTKPISISQNTPTNLSADQQKWLTLLSNLSAKQARSMSPALYARLYRGEKVWLTTVNKDHQHHPKPTRKSRINWRARDNEYVRQLRELNTFVTASREGPRRSRSFWLQRLHAPSTIAKQLPLLPLTSKLIQRYTETVADFQIRRLSSAYAHWKKYIGQPPRWRLLRDSGLSEQRLTPTARTFLTTLTELTDVPENTQNHRYQE